MFCRILRWRTRFEVCFNVSNCEVRGTLLRHNARTSAIASRGSDEIHTLQPPSVETRRENVYAGVVADRLPRPCIVLRLVAGGRRVFPVGKRRVEFMVNVADTAPIARLLGITKRFGRVAVVRDVSLDIYGGEVHVLAGENGAGKSTLISILGGIHTEFEGTITIDGREVRPRSPLEATEFGVAVIHQELSVIGPMTVADNIFLGRTPTAFGGLVCGRKQHAAARKCLEPFGLAVDVEKPIEQFSIGTQQLIEIAKALSQNAKVIVMDEPTSALNAPEVERLFQLIAELKARGCGIIYITHKMEEIERIADRITVLRDGRWIGSSPAAELPMPKLIEWMVGREAAEPVERLAAAPGEVKLRTTDFSVYPRGMKAAAAVRDVSLTVRAGEVVGLAGLQGSGISDLMWGLFGGFGRRTTGTAELEGGAMRYRGPREAIDAGVALLTNDRTSPPSS